MNDKTDDLIHRFLLDEVSEEERSQVEERFLADNDFFEKVLSIEAALLDQYLLGQLTDEQRKRARTLFESSPGQRREVEFVSELIASLRATDSANRRTIATTGEPESEETLSGVHPKEETISIDSEVASPARAFPPVPTGWKNSLLPFNARCWLVVLTICLVMMSSILYLYTKKRSLEAQRIAAEQKSRESREKLLEEARRKAELSKQLESEKEKQRRTEEKVEEKTEEKGELTARASTRRPDRLTSILLTPTTFERGGNSKALSLKATSRQIQFRLALDESQLYKRYSLQITTFDGRRVWSKDAVDASRIKKGQLALTLSTALLTDEDYRIELKGLSDNGEPVHVADYIFKVRR